MFFVYSVLGYYKWAFFIFMYCSLCDVDAVTPKLCFISFWILYVLDNANTFGPVSYFLHVLFATPEYISIHSVFSRRSLWLGTDNTITPDVYRSFSPCWIYFYKSIQIGFCAAYCTRGVNVLYKVFRSGIRFSPNSISQFSVLSRAFIILTVADKAIIFLKKLQNVDKCFCDSVSVWGGGTQILFHQSLMAHIACYKAISFVTQRKQMLWAFLCLNASHHFIFFIQWSSI